MIGVELLNGLRVACKSSKLTTDSGEKPIETQQPTVGETVTTETRETGRGDSVNSRGLKITASDFRKLQDQITEVTATENHAPFRKRCIKNGKSFTFYAWQVFHGRKNQRMTKDLQIAAYLLDSAVYNYANSNQVESALNRILDKKAYQSGK